MGLHESRRDTTPVSRVSSMSSQQQQTLVDINSESKYLHSNECREMANLYSAGAVCISEGVMGI